MIWCRENARKLIQLYFVQLTKGCGQEACTNTECATGSGHSMNPDDAATKALALASSHSKGQNKLCAAEDKLKPTSATDIQHADATNMSASISATVPPGGTAFLQKLTHISAMKARHQKKVTVSVSAPQPSSDQITKYDKSGQPVACPIDSLEAALGWMPGQDNLCVPIEPRRRCPAVLDDPSSPKILVCHDMMGGYNMDRFVQGHRYVLDILWNA